MRRAVIAVSLLLQALTAPVSAAERVALVVGNATYEHAPALANPVRDARAIANKLRGLGFEVIEMADLGHNAMRAAVSRFSQELDGADAALFFYAGHGLQAFGRNFIVPVDADLEREADLYLEAFPINDVLRVMQSTVPTRIVVLDACRDNPLARNLVRSMGRSRSGAIGRGLAQMDAPVGTLIVYATAPGEVAFDGEGQHSPFTTALLKHIETPAIDVQQVLRRVRREVIAATGERQVPWDTSSLTEDFFFAPGAIGPEPAFKAQTTTTHQEHTGDRKIPPVTGCDLAAGSPFEKNAAAPGVPLESIHVEVAEPACRRAVREWPDAPRFQVALGRVLVRANRYSEAMQWFSQAADEAYPLAQSALGFMYREGLGVTQDDAEAVRWYRRAAEQGDLRAQSSLGFMYREGRGVAQDDVEAVRWYRKAAEQGEPYGQAHLAFMYREGRGVAQDDAEAVRWFRKAAEQDEPYAQLNLGWMYHKGRGLKRDDSEAAFWVRKAADQGHVPAQYAMGQIYRDGVGVGRDPEQATYWFERAAEQGHREAQEMLRRPNR